nr:50S ribosomal protein L4P, large subunit ribosomal protein L4e [uncultured archaeon]
MKAAVYSVNGEKISEMELPVQFNEPVRDDLIKRAALAVRSRMHQKYGKDPLAGTRQGRPMSKSRHANLTCMNKGMARVSRKLMWKRGSQWYGVGARASNTIKGRRVFAPKSDKIIIEEINRKENRKAIRSAIAASSQKLILENKFEALKKAKEVIAVLVKLKFEKELERTKEKKVRAGRGKTRGRKYKRKVGPLIIISKVCDLVKAANNIPGFEVVEVNALNADLLAPGTKPGRVTIWTQAAVERLGKENLFQ